MANERIYNDPAGGSQSSVGDVQFNEFYWQKKALIEAQKEQYFGQMADTVSMPKHFGKTIKKYHYLPLLDDSNINDQGIDAAGAITEFKATVALQPPEGVLATSGANVIFITAYGTGAAAGTIARGEIGQVDQFKIIVVPEMMHWAGDGAVEGTNDGYRSTGGNYDVFPMLVVGSESFTTIGFQTNGKSVKFSIKHVKPGSTQSYNFQDPYGELGFMSIKWYYGFMVLRPERIALIKCVAEW